MEETSSTDIDRLIMDLRSQEAVTRNAAAEQLGKLNPRLPAYVMIPRMVPGTGAAYLGVSCKPFETQADPAAVGPSHGSIIGSFDNK